MNNDHIKPFDADAVLGMDGGALRAEINRKIALLIRDIADRPMMADGKATSARTLTVTLSLTPIIEFDKQTETRRMVSIACEPKIDGKCPATVGGRTDVRVIRGTALYNSADASRFDQMPLPFGDPVE